MKQKAKKALEKGNRIAVRDWFVIHLALSTGLRVQEVSELNCGDIFIENGRSYLMVRNGKCNKKRNVRFNSHFKQHCLEYLEWKRIIGESLDKDAPLIVSSCNKGRISVRGLQKIFKRNAHKTGIYGHSFHHLRHTYASMLYKASNYNLRLVQKQLGHSTIMITEIYADVLDPDIDKAMERLYK